MVRDSEGERASERERCLSKGKRDIGVESERERTTYRERESGRNTKESDAERQHARARARARVTAGAKKTARRKKKATESQDLCSFVRRGLVSKGCLECVQKFLHIFKIESCRI